MNNLAETTKAALEIIFTKGQIKKLLNPEMKRVRWCPEDIASAISLRSVSPKAYRYLRANGYPLPAMSTLRTWAATFNLNQGVLHSVCSLLKGTVANMNISDRLCVISFDEIYVSNRIDIEKKKQVKMGPHKCCQTVMVRGIGKKWKQPVYYKFDQSMTPDILSSIISDLFNIGLIVVAIVSDMGPGNMKLWSQLKIGHDKNCYFSHPSDNNLNIHVIADVPHLIKLFRNHLPDDGFQIEGDTVDKTCFEKLLSCSISELTLALKLTRFHLDVKGAQRQRVKPAVQLLSSSSSKSIEYLGECGFMPINSSWKRASNMCKIVNDWLV